MESPATAREVLAQFRRLTNKPVVAIVLTHFHFDHVNGLEVFIEDARSDLDTYSFGSLAKCQNEIL